MKSNPTTQDQVRPAFFRPFKYGAVQFPDFPLPGEPRNGAQPSFLDALILREQHSKRKKTKRKPVKGVLSIDESWPMATREHGAVVRDTRVGLHKLLSWFEKTGDTEFVRDFWELLEEPIRRLNRIALEHPERLHPFSERAHAWPILYSKHKTLSQRNEKIVEALKLGSRHGFNVDQFARTDFDDELTRTASALVGYLETARWTLMSLRNPYKPGSKAGTGYCFDISMLPKWYLAADQLDDFCEGTWLDWWPVAEAAFLESYPKPEIDPRFNYVKDGVGRRRSRIMARLKASMEQLANSQS